MPDEKPALPHQHLVDVGAWCLGILFLFLGLTLSLGSIREPVPYLIGSGIALILIGLFTIPIVREQIEDIQARKIKPVLTLSIIIIGLVVSTGTIYFARHDPALHDSTSDKSLEKEQHTSTKATESTISTTKSKTDASTEKSSPTSKVKTTQKSIPTPGYEIVQTKDLSYAGVVRLQFDIKTERPISDLSDKELLDISKQITSQVTSEKNVNAITIFFWERHAMVGSERAYVSVDWAPYGEWYRAGEVQTGNYKHHQYTVRDLKRNSSY